MRNINQRNSFVAKLSHHAKELLYLRNGQRGGGLIQNNNLRIIRYCLGNLAHLSLGNRHGPHRSGKADGKSESAEKICCLYLHSCLINNTCRIHRISSEEQVVNYASLQALIQFLMNHCNSVFQCILRTGEVYFLPVQNNGSFILLISTEEALHHRRFSCAVLAHQAHDGSALHIHVDVIQNLVAAEGLTHSVNRQDDVIFFFFCHCLLPLFH